MDILNELRQKNPSLPLYEVTDTAFARYGRVPGGLAPPGKAARRRFPQFWGHFPLR